LPQNFPDIFLILTKISDISLINSC